jgi:UDP-glucose 4-epimerase
LAKLKHFYPGPSSPNPSVRGAKPVGNLFGFVVPLTSWVQPSQMTFVVTGAKGRTEEVALTDIGEEHSIYLGDGFLSGLTNNILETPQRVIMRVNSLRCLVLGGRGFIGSHLVEGLLEQGFQVRCFGRSHDVSLTNNACSPNKHLEIFEGDLMSEADLSEALTGCDLCFHLISTTQPKSSNEDPLFDVESNLAGTIKLLKQAVKAGTKKIIFTSSGGTVYGVPVQTPIPEEHPNNPTCSYGITKLAIEKYLSLFHTLYGLEYGILRISNPFGERQRTQASQGAVAVFLSKALRNEEIEIWGDGSVVRDYIYIKDVISALISVSKYSGPEHIFNIGSGSGMSINELLNAIENITKRPTKRKYVNARSFDVPVSVLNIKKAKSILGWSPCISFEEGLDHFARWIEKQTQNKKVCNDNL